MIKISVDGEPYHFTHNTGIVIASFVDSIEQQLKPFEEELKYYESILYINLDTQEGKMNADFVNAPEDLINRVNTALEQ